MVCGFIVQRLTEGGVRTGFRVVPINSEFPPSIIEFEISMPGIFIHRGKHDITVLEEAIEQVEQSSHDPRFKLLLLDEIGGIELTSRVFSDTLNRILSGNIPCIGVWKSRENLIRASGMLGLETVYDKLHRECETNIKKYAELFTVTEKNITEIKEHLKKYIDSIFM